jgi:serine/threonine protein kinase
MISEPALDRLAGLLRRPDVSGTRYELLAVLGRGGMGVVYLARDTVLDREVALKIVDRATSPDGSAADTASALSNEARILARLEHPGIVPVHDFGELPDGRLFYAMKQVRGERLDRWMSGDRSLADRLAVFLRICEAVSFAHARGVVHCDLKPENVMVGEFGEVLVLDWGIANQALAGTPPFMAPEQTRAGGAIDPRTDVHALGAILETMSRAPALAAIAAKARAMDPSGRYQAVASLAADVNRFLAGGAVEAHRERLVDRLSRVWRRHKVMIVLVTTYLIVRLLLIWFARV